MTGQPAVFDMYVVAKETGGPPQIPPYFIVEPGDLEISTYFHCGGDSVVRNQILAAMNTGTGPTVSYYFQDLQAGGAVIPIVTGPLLIPPYGPSDALFTGAGDLVGSGLDPTDDYYVKVQAIDAGTLPVMSGTTGTWRCLIVFRGVDSSGQVITAFDDSLIVQVLG